MTTFDRNGRMLSRFMPPTDESGRPIGHAEYIKRKALAMVAVRGTAGTLEWLAKYREAGPVDAPKFITAMDAAEAAVKAADSGSIAGDDK